MQLDDLLVRLAAGVGATAKTFKVQAVIIAGASVVMAVVGAVMGYWIVVPVVLGFGGGMGLLARAAVHNTGMMRAQPVLAALRDAPARVTSIRHLTTGKGRGRLAQHWIEMKTADGRLLIRADADWQSILDAGARRCADATVQRGA